MKVRPFDKQDLHAVLAIQEKNPLAAHWLARDYQRLAADPRGMILVVELEAMTPAKVLGFAIFQRVIDQAELMNMAVDPEQQHKGVGKALLEDARRRLHAFGIRRVFLEVRESNKTAQQFYYSAGFGLHSVRKDYYHDPREDAYVLWLELFPPTMDSTRP